MHESFSGSSASKAGIKTLPLLAVLFCLFATFAVCAFSMKRITVLENNFPGCSFDSTGKDKGTALFLQAAEGGRIYWKQGAESKSEEITVAELRERLAASQRTSTAPHVLICSDPHATLGATIRLLDEVRKAKIEHVTFDEHSTLTGL